MQAEPEPRVAIVVAARNEAQGIAATLDALAGAFPGAAIWVADDASTDETAPIAMQRGGRIVSLGRPHGKGGNVTAACEAMLSDPEPPDVVLLCDADLGESAARLTRLVDALDGRCDLAIAVFARRVGGGLGIAVGTARWAIRRATGREMRAPISGQRAMRPEVLRDVRGGAGPRASGDRPHGRRLRPPRPPNARHPARIRLASPRHAARIAFAP